MTWPPVAGTGESPRLAPLPYDDRELLLDVDQWAFGFDDTGIDAEPVLAALEWDRTVGAYLGTPPRLAGTSAVYSFRMAVPGGEVPCAGLTWVGVHPQFRRRGVLRRLMRHHLDAVHDAGEPVSALFAAEPGIYGRFGYGPATQAVRLTIPRGATLRDVPGSADLHLRMERVDLDSHADLVSDCLDAATAARPGRMARSAPAWRRMVLDDQPMFRHGAEARRLLIAEDVDGAVRGYALFRRRMTDADGGRDGAVQVREMAALDAAAARAVWGVLLDLDLTARVVTDGRPPDDPLLHLLTDPWSATPTLGDGLWVRLVDLPAALAARRYAAPVDVVLDVTDALCPWNVGRWRLVAGPDGATCTPAQGPADLTVDVGELGAAYLGWITLDALAGGGLLTAPRPEALAPASIAFSWPVAAHSAWVF
jgi:predicted acetyltransferase